MKTQFLRVKLTFCLATMSGVPFLFQATAQNTNHTVGYVVSWGEVGLPYVAPGTTFVKIAAGGSHNLAVTSDGTVVAWGWVGSSASTPLYTVPTGLTGVVSIAAGELHNLALKDDGTVVAWGYNNFGECTVPTGLSNVVSVAAGRVHSLALKADGTVVAWGEGERPPYPFPPYDYDNFCQSMVPQGLSNVVAVAAGRYHSMALKNDGTVVAWGSNEGSLGGYCGQSTVPQELSNVVAIAAAGYHSLALKNDGTVVAWGDTDVPEGLNNVVAIATGGVHPNSLALKDDGMVVAWGWNEQGESTVPEGLSNVVAIAEGGHHSLVLKHDGTVVAWGSNDAGQSTAPGQFYDVVAVAAGYYHSLALKNNGMVVNLVGKSAVPEGLNHVVAIAVGVDHSLALKDDGTVVAWGGSEYGESTVPVGLSNVVAIAAGQHHSVALKDDGTVVAWGGSEYGECAVPDGLSNVVAIASGGFHCLALKTDGTAVAWGRNTGASGWYRGQSTAPEGLSNVVAIAAGWYHSLALKSDRTVVAWGDNGDRQCTVPTGLSNVVAISAGARHSLALKNDGTVVAWGSSQYRQSTVPEGLTNVVVIAGDVHSGLALVQYAPPALRNASVSQTAYLGSSVDFTADATGCPSPYYLWFANGTNLVKCSTSSRLALSDLQYSQIGAYTVVVANAFGAVTSTPVMLNVIAPVEQCPVPAVSLFGKAGDVLGLDYRDSLNPASNWQTLTTTTLTDAFDLYFDLTVPAPPQRFYRVWLGTSSAQEPELDLHIAQAIALTGKVGDSQRVDYINAIGPTDAWVTLDTVTLTNTSQRYFDVSSIGQPCRLYRIVPVP